MAFSAIAVAMDDTMGGTSNNSLYESRRTFTIQSTFQKSKRGYFIVKIYIYMLAGEDDGEDEDERTPKRARTDLPTIVASNQKLLAIVVEVC